MLKVPYIKFGVITYVAKDYIAINLKTINQKML